MTFAIISDLHLGGRGVGRWHNRLLYDRAESVARRAVAALNAEPLDVVYVLGDITESGAEEQLTLAREIFAGFRAPWFVLQGNHDRAAVRSGRFDAVFGDRVLPVFALRDGVAVAALREKSSEAGGAADRYRLDETEVAEILNRLRERRPDALLLFSHQPLAANAEWAVAQGGKDAGYYRDGRDLLDRAARLAGRVAAFCGHQHWHHLVRGPNWVQSATAALIEYPMEARIVTWDGGRMTTRLLAIHPASAVQSLDGAAWVGGRKEDREGTLDWRKGDFL